jgi:hypothetical protein
MWLLVHDLGSLFTLCRMPALLKLHRTELAHSRVQTAVTLEGHPVHDGINGLLAGAEFFAVQAGSLQPFPEALRGCVGLAIALYAHR